MIRNNTWVLVPRFPDGSLTSNLWLFKVKEKALKQFQVNGMNQVEGKD